MWGLPLCGYLYCAEDSFSFHKKRLPFRSDLVVNMFRNRLLSKKKCDDNVDAYGLQLKYWAVTF